MRVSRISLRIADDPASLMTNTTRSIDVVAVVSGKEDELLCLRQGGINLELEALTRLGVARLRVLGTLLSWYTLSGRSRRLGRHYACIVSTGG